MKTKNKLLNKKVIRERLEKIKEGFANNEIERMAVYEDDQAFLRNLISQGKSEEEIILEIKNRLNFNTE